ncbi:MAG: lysylphosphatidylglycerol synthase transmembrane domain-containing protein [Eubacteriales bacterium]|nr:lysylphosphatidylglycerol synthase transmembrane domain-containing protein [Eubacteriales bacterium]
MFKKNIRFMILSLLIAVFSIWAVSSMSSNFTVAQLCDDLTDANMFWIGLALVLMPGFIIFEGFAVASLVKGLCGKKAYRKGIVYGAADVYFSAITPSASGGQPASAFFMMWDGITAAQTTVILLVNLIMYSLALLLCGAVAFICAIPLFLSYDIFAMVLIVVGIFAMFGLLILFILLLKKEEIIRKIAYWLIKLGSKIHIIRKPEKYVEKLDRLTSQYKNSANAMKGKRKILLEALFFNILQRLSQSMVTVCVYLGMEGNLRHAFKVWLVQMLSALGSNSIPIPGGMGVADYLLLQGLEKIEGVDSVVNLELVCRGLSFYGCVVTSIVIILVGYLLRIRKNNPLKEENK